MKLSLLLFIILIFLITLLSGFFSGLLVVAQDLLMYQDFIYYCIIFINDHLMQVAIASAVSSGISVGLLATLKQHKYKQICYDTLRWSLISILLGGILGVFLVNISKYN